MALILALGAGSGLPTYTAAKDADGDHDAVVWIKPFESENSVLCNAMATTAKGFAAIGEFVGEIDFGSKVRVKGFGGKDGYVAVFDSDGKPRWARAIGGIRDDRLRAIATDADGNVYVSGYIIGPDSTPTEPATSLPATAGGADAVLVKLSPAGQRLWTRRIASEYADVGTALAVAADGSVFWGGQFEKNASMVGFPELGTLLNTGSSDAFVAAFDRDGKPRWLKSFGGKQSDELWSLAADAEGGVFVAGAYEGILPIRHPRSLDLLRAKGGRDAFLMHLRDKGEIDWAHSLSGKQNEYPVTVLSDGEQLFLTGNFQDKLQLDAQTTLSSHGVFDGFISAWSLGGQLKWAKGFGGASAETVQGFTYGQSGRMTLVGSFLGPFDFGPDTRKLDTKQLRPFVASIDNQGHWLQEFALPSTEPADILGITAGPGEDVYACGVAKGDIVEGLRSGRDNEEAEEEREKAERARESAKEEHEHESGKGEHGKKNSHAEEEENEKSGAFIARLRTH
ncbi:MAG: hypothetical protein ABI451_04090 [Dokdonella sp.]